MKLRLRAQSLTPRRCLQWGPWLGVQVVRDGWVIASIVLRPRTAPAIALVAVLWLVGKVIERLVEPAPESEGDGDAHDAPP